MTIGDIGGFYDANKVLTGSAVGYIAPHGTTSGGVFTPTPDPADSLIVFDPLNWVSPYVSAGSTEQGWQVNWNPNTQDINIDEQPTAVDQQMPTASLQFVANLSEDSVQSWQWAMNADKSVQAPSSTLFGKTTLIPNRRLKYYKVALETQSQNEFPVRYVVDKMTCASNVGVTFRRAAGQRLVPVTFTAVCPLSGIKRTEITAAKTA